MTQVQTASLTASDVARRIAVRCADPGVLSSAIAAAARQSPYADVLPWRAASLAQGHAGIAVLCAELDRLEPGSGWDRAGHRSLAAAVSEATPRDPSLFSGLAGIGFAAIRLASGRPARYTRLLASVDAALAPRVEHLCERLDAADGCSARDVDLVSGLTGITVYLLSRAEADVGHPGGGQGDDAGLQRALAALARLLSDPAPAGRPLRWHTPVHLATGSLREAYPRGHYNCGLAHGVPGPLALLSLAVLSGAEVDGSRAAIEAAATWLADHRVGSAEEPDWPDAVPLDCVSATKDVPATNEVPATINDARPGRAAWCYGAPGVARSLWLAGAALDRPDWRDLAARSVRAIARRPGEWWLATPAFCHGEAGLLQVLRRFAADLRDPVVAATAAALAGDLAARFDPEHLLGIRTVEPDDVLVDHPGLLDGAPGMALALLGPTVTDGGRVAGSRSEPGWDRMFLLS